MSNRYLEGGFAPIDKEFTLTDLTVTGAIPDYLDGRYLRNGPNPIGDLDPELYHWFGGDGMVHGIRIADGKAHWYRNRWVRGPITSMALDEQPVVTGLPGVFGVGANTNVVGHAGKTLALMEGGGPVYELSEELDTVGVCDFDGTLSGGYTAHPKRDPETGELHAVSYSFGRGNTVQYTVIGADGRARRALDIEVTGSPMMHDFSLTERHVILYDLPVTFDTGLIAERIPVPRLLRLPARLLLSALIGRVKIPAPRAGAPTKPPRDRRLPYRWNPKYPARVGVLPRDGGAGDVRWFEIEPCYVFHPMNAYDDGDTVVLDVVRHPKMFDTSPLGPNEGAPTLDRWVVDLAAGKVRQSRLHDFPQEFPRVDERLVGRRHRYGYAAGVGAGLSGNSTVLKHDVLGGGSVERSLGSGKEVGEFIFHPSAPDAAEDDGVLMGFVYDRAADRSDLMLLDAGTLETVAAIHLPHRVPTGFHGNWVPAAS
ncbi:carotenoid oxygenase [Nocardia panacis]|uniref:Dioxygenase n=1 Tax=Nocardia panacis TaxID=2340916 RepID=A0A3A4K8T7_9NOCA|nr:carotenoid oxygenase family protein [Nocardia panacis]RJO68328.1 carotenoid oxygenase [Nocardia panacis]